MGLENFIESIALIKPEVVISVTLVVVLIFDLIFKDKKQIVPYIGLAGLVITLFTLFAQTGVTQTAFLTKANSQYGMFAVDPMGTFIKIIVILSSLFVIFMSLSSEEIKSVTPRSGEYYTLVFGMILGMMTLASASDLILIYLSLELMSLSSYVLAGFLKLQKRPAESSLKYMIFGAVSSGIMLFGISILYGIYGTTNLYSIAQYGNVEGIRFITLTVAAIFVFAGIGYKISSVPFHFWTPDVYEGAPIPITAYLSVASKAAGFALLIRVVRIGFTGGTDEHGFWQLLHGFDWRTFIVLLAVLTMTVGNMIALWQDNLKRMLAYSSIAHAGYMLMALAAFSNESLLAIILYFVFYMLMNFGAFYVIMLVANKTGSEDINKYTGMGYTSPFITTMMGIFLFSLAGIPPFAGFIGKLYIFIAVVDAKLITLAVIGLLNSTLSLYYYARVMKHMLLSKPNEDTPKIEVGLYDKIMLLIFAVPTLLFGIFFQQVVNFAQQSAKILGF
jgi:NADH-quinone oxidoreductase subunit N